MVITKEKLTIISLSLEGISNYKDFIIIEQYAGSYDEFWNLSPTCIDHLFPKAAEKRAKIKKVLLNPEEYRKRIANLRSQCQIITIFDDGYPALLKNIYDPPFVLYVRGNLRSDIPLIAMVGARKASSYGKWAAREFSQRLVENGIGVISGLAYGIDALSHEGALEGGGYTIGILGCGIDYIYPASNSKIYERVIRTGAIISEYPPGFSPQKHYFPARNRIISGISNGVFIIEAGEKSGSLITADFAMEQGKEVYALPGHITHALSSGTNQLIQDGAKMVLKPEDIIDELESKQLLKKNTGSRPSNFSNLSKKENQLIDLIAKKETSIDELVYLMDLPVWEINSMITVLELKGMVTTVGGRIFTSIR
ncbi:DNA-processing protein DprA [Tindallia californiensis]|uniref:DNA processing protein n=1 Tax=Tindallia californiensis TaxID=159292 RepID=A0A1H3NUP1_9FIRM|nr:DNA-processing protein DprA [Tindallia californiensis]SDY91879.1 DNA processing protein [Tindallia californiensis]